MIKINGQLVFSTKILSIIFKFFDFNYLEIGDKNIFTLSRVNKLSSLFYAENVSIMGAHAVPIISHQLLSYVTTSRVKFSFMQNHSFYSKFAESFVGLKLKI